MRILPSDGQDCPVYIIVIMAVAANAHVTTAAATVYINVTRLCG